MKIKKFKSYERGSLQGFFEVELPSGMCIRDLTLHSKDGSRWVGYPSKPYTDEDGNTKYQNQIFFPDKAVHQKFQQGLLSALDLYFAANKDDDPGDVPF